MLPLPRPSGKCIYCAFRAQRLILQSLRRKSTLSGTKHKHLTLNNPPIQYYQAGKSSDKNYPKHSVHGGKVSDDGRIRRVFKRDLEQWGLDAQKKKLKEKQENYNDVLHKRLNALKEELKESPLLEQMRKEKQDDGGKADSFSKLWKGFTQKITMGGANAEGVPWMGGKGDENASRMAKELREVFMTRGVPSLDERIKYYFYGHVTGSRFTESDIRNQKTLADLRYPTEWYPATRVLHRTIHLHVGPTNSGKTYHALQRLEQAQTGVYAGPLRLLAHEVYTRMNAKGKPCALVTGEERRGVEQSQKVGDVDMSSCTVEMMPLNKTLDVAVIDEIQMIGNAERGWAWTQALLGVKAKEVHLCGEERTVPLIQELCASVGEKLVIHRYERLSPLRVADESLDGDLRRLRKGDCIVSFSVMGIHALRRQIERQTGRKVATVYGSLPPETRAQQARLFNDPHNDYDFLVASDAVGMGLNLAIKRIIFEASAKFDGFTRRTLSVADTKQIAGRAGRYRTAEQASQQPTSTQDLAAAKGDSPAEVIEQRKNESVGIVTTLEKFDYPIVAAAMAAEPEPIRTAGLFPPASVLERFASYFPPGTPFSYILLRLHELSQMHSRFHLCGLKEQLWIADIIESVQGLTITDRNIICSAPASKTDDMWKTLMPAYARCIAEQTACNIADVEELPLEVLEADVSPSREYLRELERLHKGIVTYLWLSYRFAGIFTTRALAFHVKGLVEEKIEDVLSKFSFSEAARKKVAAARQKQVLEEMLMGAEEEEKVGEGVEMGSSAKEVEEEGRETAELSAEQSVDAESDFEESEIRQHDSLEEQTSLTAGGDRFAGEEDIELEDPDVEATVEEKEPAASSFALWRQRQMPGEDQGSHEVDDAGSPSIAEASAEGAEMGVSAARRDGGENDGASRPSVSHAFNVEADSDVSPTEGMSPVSGASSHHASQLRTPDTEYSEDGQASSPKTAQASGREPASSALRPSESQFGGGLPPKHLHAHLDVTSAAEVERDAITRP